VNENRVELDDNEPSLHFTAACTPTHGAAVRVAFHCILAYDVQPVTQVKPLVL